MRQLNQRISIRYRLRPLRREEVPRYIQHRLMVAGSSGDIIFTSGAVRQVSLFSGGIPRLINLACDRALLAGYAQQSREIQRATVLKGLKSLEGRDMVGSARPLRKNLTLALAAVAIFCLGIVAAGVWSDADWFFFSEGLKRSVSASSGSQLASLDKARRTPFYTVQLGVYQNKDAVMEVAKRVKGTGYPLFLNKDIQDGRARHRIFIGKFKRKGEAEEVAETFRKAKGFPKIKVILTTSMISKVTTQ